MTFLLDTNVVSELRKQKPNKEVAAWYAEVSASELYLSVLVVGEIRHGIERLARRGDARQAAMLERWLAVLRTQFVDRVLPVTIGIAERWGALNAERSVPVVDGLLAATALEHELTLVTRDDAVASTGARVLNPWRP